MNKNAEIILNVINASTDHPTAEQVYLRLQEQGTKVSMATVYNNLASLYSNGLIRKVAVAGFPDRYDNITRHDHLVCKNCGKLADVFLEDFTQAIQHDAGVKILSYDLNVTYLCPECAEACAEPGALHNKE